MQFQRFSKRFTAFVLLFLTVFGITACKDTVEIQKTDAGDPCIVNLAAVGDIQMSDDQLKAVRQPDGSYDFTSVFSSVAADLIGADLTIGNLEGNFCGDPADAQTHNYPIALADALHEIGFDILQTANTYSVENGLSGLRTTKETIEAAGMAAVGTFADSNDRSENGVYLAEINGIRFAFVAFTKGVNNVRLPDGADYCVNLLYSDYDSNYSDIDRSQIIACMGEVALLQPDVIIALVHWGSEYSDKISSTQVEIENLLLQNGADVILGTHSHLVGKMEQRQITLPSGKEKNVFIAYSLGNFYCDSFESDAQISMILNMEFTKYSDGTIAISNASYTPLYIADNGKTAAVRYQVLNARNAIRQYDSSYYDRVSPEIYEKLRGSIEALSEQMQWNFKAP